MSCKRPIHVDSAVTSIVQIHFLQKIRTALRPNDNDAHINNYHPSNKQTRTLTPLPDCTH